MDDLRQVGVILQESRIFVRKEVSIANSTELTKLYILLTDSLRLIRYNPQPQITQMCTVICVTCVLCESGASTEENRVGNRAVRKPPGSFVCAAAPWFVAVSGVGSV